MLQIKKIQSTDTYSVRHPVLRKGKAIETCKFDHDEAVSTVHFGAFLDEKLIGVVSLFEKSNSAFEDKKQFQLRGMAILEDYQKKGIGEKLIIFLENHVNASDRNAVIWLNARESAFKFYEKLNYSVTGNIFDIQDIGKHYLMFKRLES
jgi:GNAT superfamily N-acetyltransferase